MNWFDKHLNWTNGIFGHLLVFILVAIYISPSEAWGRALIEYLTGRLALFRTREYGIYHDVLMAAYFLLALALYLGVNIWYLRMKHQSYKYLWWLCLPSIPLGMYLAAFSTGLYNQIHWPIVNWIIGITTIIMQPIWFTLVAIIILRLRNNKKIGQ